MFKAMDSLHMGRVQLIRNMQKRNEGDFNIQPKLQLEDIPFLPHTKGVSPKYNKDKEQSFQYTSNSPWNTNMKDKVEMEQEMEDEDLKSFKLHTAKFGKYDHDTTRNSEYTSYQDEDSLNEAKVDLKGDLVEELIDSEIKEIETGKNLYNSSVVNKDSSCSSIHIINNTLKELKEMNLRNIEEIESLLDHLNKNE